MHEIIFSPFSISPPFNLIAFSEKQLLKIYTCFFILFPIRKREERKSKMIAFSKVRLFLAAVNLLEITMQNVGVLAFLLQRRGSK